MSDYPGNEETDLLKERVKELNCLYEISSVINDKETSLQAALQKIVNIIPPAMQYPDISSARIQFGDDVFESVGFGDSPWRLSSDLRILGETVGTLSICL